MFCQGTELKIDQLVLLSPQKNALGIVHNMVHLVVHLRISGARTLAW